MIDEKKLIEAIIKDRTAFRSELYTDDSIRKYFVGIIDEQQKVGEWIPCSERLPENLETVLTCDEKGNIHTLKHCHFFYIRLVLVQLIYGIIHQLHGNHFPNRTSHPHQTGKNQ